MTGDLVRPIAIISFFALALIVVAITSYAQRKRQAAQLLERKARIEEGVARGECNEFGEALCTVCGAIALHPSPVTGRMWFDKIPGLRMLNELMAMPWRYTITDDELGALRLCSRHRRAAERRLRELHSQLRAEHAQFNSRQHEKLDLLDRGGLEKMLLEDERVIKQQLGYASEVRKSLRNATSSSVDALHVLPGRSSITTEAEE